MQKIAAKDRKVANIYDAEFTPFVYDDGLALGDAILQHDDGVAL